MFSPQKLRNKIETMKGELIKVTRAYMGQRKKSESLHDRNRKHDLPNTGYLTELICSYICLHINSVK